MISESPAQADRREAVRTFFQTKTLRPSTIGQPRPPSSPRPVIHRSQGSKTVNQATGGTVIVKDCEGTELFRMKKVSGIDGEQELRAGCDDSSSGSVG